MLSELDSHLKQLETSILSTPWHDKHVYGAFLAQTYHYVCHSTRLLALAASRFDRRDEPIHRRMLRHAAEEMSHETLALRDLQTLGLSIDAFPEVPPTSAFYQRQYYVIEHVSPWGFWGYILMLEGLAISKGTWMWSTVTKHHGEKAGSFLKVHAAEDVAHMAEAEKALRLLPDAQRPLVVEEIAASTFHYRAMLGECARFARG